MIGARAAAPLAGLVDCHCHLDAEELGSADDALAEARAAGVATIVMAGVDPANWAAQRALAARLPGVHPVFGLHPQCVAEMSEAACADALAALAATLAAHRPVALGELGLDRLTPARKAALGLQEEVFRAQLRLAIQHDLPLVLHLLRADEPALAILAAEGIPRAGGLVHSFSGAADFARRLVALGLHVSFCGTLTFPQSRRLREAARAVPPERLLVETDTPDQTPEPERTAAPPRAGQGGRVQQRQVSAPRTATWPQAVVPTAGAHVEVPWGPGPIRRTNRPAYLPSIVQALAAAREAPLEAIAALTATNARHLFRLDAD